MYSLSVMLPEVNLLRRAIADELFEFTGQFKEEVCEQQADYVISLLERMRIACAMESDKWRGQAGQTAMVRATPLEAALSEPEGK